jgi:hypothetical protein
MKIPSVELRRRPQKLSGKRPGRGNTKTTPNLKTAPPSGFTECGKPASSESRSEFAGAVPRKKARLFQRAANHAVVS